jgi:hypothetical protein
LFAGPQQSDLVRHWVVAGTATRERTETDGSILIAGRIGLKRHGANSRVVAAGIAKNRGGTHSRVEVDIEAVVMGKERASTNGSV